jgi:ATP-dependent Lon protease
MQTEIEILQVEKKIRSRVKKQMERTQKEYYLNEQMQAIQKELGGGERDEFRNELAEVEDKLKTKKLTEEAKGRVEKELKKLKMMHPTSAEATVVRNYIDWVLSLPWFEKSEEKRDIVEAEKVLAEDHYGLRKVKERIVEYLAVQALTSRLKGPILCFVGPPGVGKTSIAKSIARATGRKFVRISLGGVRDEAEIRGHRRTYIGALPGKIIQNLKKVESNNPLFLLDEIDKMSTDFRGDPASALLEVLDPAQNNTFTDHYLDLPFDLSRVLFITTANWLDPIHPALRDRLEVIELPSYTAAEKLQIAKGFLVPRQLEEHGLKRKLVRFPDATLRRVIQDYTREAGVRQLEREIASLTRKAARKIVTQKNAAEPLAIWPKQLPDILGPAKFISEAAERITEYGIAIGLAWTPVGGEILFIEATKMPGKGNLILTGSLGDVMKESAQTALSYLRSQAKRLDLQPADFARFDIHIHVPAGATPKDGPSAGSTIAVALASLLTRRLVRSDLAMTGEISLRGRILRVGGIKEKVLAAARSGLRQVALPAQNKNDWQEVTEEVRAKMKVHFVNHISELLEIALKPK